MRKSFSLFFGLLILNFSCTKPDYPVVQMETKYGNIIFEIYTDKAPVTANNFLKYVDDDLFKGAKFYRVVRKDNQAYNDIKIEVVQWGLLLNDDEYVLPPIEHETTEATGILHKDGVISDHFIKLWVKHIF